MLASHVSEAVDDPGSLVIASICQGVTGLTRALLRMKVQVRVVDQVEDVLPPRHQILPDVDVVPQVRQAIAPAGEEEFELLRLAVEVLLSRLGEAGSDDVAVVEFDEFLEGMQERDVGVDMI